MSKMHATHLVQCDNQRPLCKKCIDGGRECAGYERETVFIVGTIHDQGRCSSHPPRVLKTKTSKGPPTGDDRLELVPTAPLRPAWDDLILVSSRGQSHQLQIAALHTQLHAITRGAVHDDGHAAGSRPVFISFPPYELPTVPPVSGENEFQLASQCFVHLAAPVGTQGGDIHNRTDSILLFLYEVSRIGREAALLPC